MKNEEIICYCSNVTKAQIIKAMERKRRKRIMIENKTWNIENV